LGGRDVHTAAAKVLVDEIVAPIVARGMEARVAYLEAVQMCEAALQLMSPRWGSAHPFHSYSTEHSRIHELVRELAVPDSASDPATRELVGRLAGFAAGGGTRD
jgi:hypothetical protein